MQNKSEMINRIAELAEENAELKKYIERMDKPEIQVIDAEILTLKEENAKLNAIIDSYQPRLQRYRVELAELKSYKDVNKDFKIAWEELKTENEKLRRDRRHLKDNLQEIKEIVENGKRFAENYMITGEQKTNVLAYANRILDIINKAEEE